MSRTLVIGDVHGCADELSALLSACGHTPADRVVLVGDLLTKGPNPHAVLTLMRELGADAVCGNHDAHMLRWKRAIDDGEEPVRFGRDGDGFMRELSDADWALLSGLPLYLRLPEYDAWVVHAGLVPGVPLEAQEPDVLLNVRTIRPDGTPSKRPDDGPLWGTLWHGPQLVLFGHHASRGLQQHPHAIGLDTGCVYGGKLSACILPERRIVSVDARRVYREVDP